MIGLGRLRRWLRTRARRAQLERDMEEEMRMHLDMEAAVAVVESYIPARRAAEVGPMTALRAE